jgi:hypothetical protein
LWQQVRAPVSRARNDHPPVLLLIRLKSFWFFFPEQVGKDSQGTVKLLILGESRSSF